MATRRDVLRLAGVTGAALLASGCARKVRTAPGPAITDLLYVATPGGLAVLSADRGRPVVDAAPAIATADWQHLISATAVDAGTRVTIRDTGGERIKTDLVVPGRLTARAANPSGALVALVTSPDGATAYADGSAPLRPAGRESTTIAVVGEAGERYRFTLAGCLEPEAFSVDGARLFVLDYLPPRHPDSYRVRVLDLATGTVGSLGIWPKQAPPADPEEWMRGEGRQAVYDQQRKTLFTLYTQQADYAFVHTLSLADGWAYCVDLPEPFGRALAAAHTIARSPDGRVLYVTDAATGTIAVIDPDALSITRTAKTEPLAAASAASTISPDSRLLFVSAGPTVTRLEASALATTGRWSLPAPVRGIAASPDGKRLYVGQPDAVLALDAQTGAVTSRIAVPGLTTLRHASAG